MSLSNIHKALYSILSATSETYVGIRAAGSATPCIVYEITSASADLPMAGTLAKNHWTIGTEVKVIADSLEEVLVLVDDLVDTFNAPKNDVTNACSIVVSSIDVSFSVEALEDGREDGTRMGTIQFTLLVQED